MITLRFLKLILTISMLFSVSSASAAVPERIISLAPSTTELLFAMGLGDRVIGVTSFCDYPEEAKKKPKIGGMSNPSLEAVLSSRPDMVVMTTDGNQKEFAERLRSLKIRTYIFRATRLAELPLGIRDMGSALGVKEKADSLAHGLELSIEKTLRDRKSGSATGNIHRKKVLFIIWPEPLIVAGPGTSIDDAVNLLGAVNIASGAKAPYPKFSIEEIMRRSPDIIFIGKGHAEMQELSQGLLKKIANIPAVRNKKVFFLSDNLYRLGPRIVKGMEELAACLK
jgi:iron complex transport system substrate-binding protein